jgi:predicted phosphodiesterase
MPATLKMLKHDLSGLNHETIELYPISDMHVGSREFNEGALAKTVREIAAEPNRYVLLGGDLCDNATKSSVGDIYRATMPPRDQPQYVAELLQPIKERILAVVSGNHCWRTMKDVDLDPMAMIAAKLNSEHLYEPDIAFIKLVAGSRVSNGVRPPKYCIALTHGAGGGALLGAGLNKAEPFALAMGVDMLVTGHTHRPMTAPAMRYECDMAKGVMVPREVRIMISTGYLDWMGYPARKMLKPLPIRQNKAILSCTEHDIAVLT